MLHVPHLMLDLLLHATTLHNYGIFPRHRGGAWLGFGGDRLNEFGLGTFGLSGFGDY